MSTADDSLAQLRADIGFKRIPVIAGPDASMFLGFLSFASGDSDEANALQEIFDAGHADPKKRSEENLAGYIDWLIVNYWGDEATHGASPSPAAPAPK